jgi:hypothetical protein
LIGEKVPGVMGNRYVDQERGEGGGKGETRRSRTRADE